MEKTARGEPNMMPQRGAIAMCGAGRIGVIESNGPEEITYEDGNTGLAWTGHHIWPPEWFGKPWSSRSPRVLLLLNVQHLDEK